MRYLLVAAMAAALMGCGESGPTLIPISGTVTHNGKPVEGASVIFTPDPSNSLGQPATDITGPEGNYKAMTNNRSGVVPGKYKVHVLKVPTPTEAENESFKDDPFMAQLTVTPLAGTRKKNDPASGTLEGSFDRDVTSAEPVLDFDVKTKAAAAKDAKSSS